jgi:hypothetical protein
MSTAALNLLKARIRDAVRTRPEPPAEREDYEAWGRAFALIVVRRSLYSRPLLLSSLVIGSLSIDTRFGRRSRNRRTRLGIYCGFGAVRGSIVVGVGRGFLSGVV